MNFDYERGEDAILRGVKSSVKISFMPDIKFVEIRLKGEMKVSST